MNALSFYNLLKNPSLLNANTLSELEQLIDAYPYAENFRILYVLNLLILDDFRYQDKLSQAAFYASDRKKLKYLIDSYHYKPKDDFSVITETYRDEVRESINPAPHQDNEIEIDNNDIKTSTQVIKKTINHLSENEENEEFNNDKLQEEKTAKIVKSKAELLSLVKKRLAEIEKAKETDFAGKHDPQQAEEDPSPSSLVDKFIASQPSISRPDKNDFFDPQNEAIDSTTDDDDFFVTETLARIHKDQGNLKKAIEIYQKLILKIPEKSSYFAAQIQDLNKIKKK